MDGAGDSPEADGATGPADDDGTEPTIEAIAHDINNVLAVVQGHLEFLADEVESLPNSTRRIASMTAAVSRGGALVERLLATDQARRSPPPPA